MAAPTLVFSEANNNAGVAKNTDNITTINFASGDVNSATPSILTTYPVAAGSNSFEKYNMMKVVAASQNTLSAFSVYFNATPPQDGAGQSNTITMKYGVTGAFNPPTSAVSAIATNLCSATTTSPGTSFTQPANTVGSYSGYFVQQLQTLASAIGGNCVFPASWATCQYTYSALAVAFLGAAFHAISTALSALHALT
jgi:hypothetical protein